MHDFVDFDSSHGPTDNVRLHTQFIKSRFVLSFRFFISVSPPVGLEIILDIPGSPRGKRKGPRYVQILF